MNNTNELRRQLLSTIGSKRGKIVVEHIIDKGYITTEELSSEYGYKHPPRAARDVREAGIPLETFYMNNSEGKILLSI